MKGCLQLEGHHGHHLRPSLGGHLGHLRRADFGGGRRGRSGGRIVRSRPGESLLALCAFGLTGLRLRRCDFGEDGGVHRSDLLGPDDFCRNWRPGGRSELVQGLQCQLKRYLIRTRRITSFLGGGSTRRKAKPGERDQMAREAREAAQEAAAR